MTLIWLLVLIAGFYFGMKLADIVTAYVSHSWHARQDRLLLEELRNR